WRVSRMKPTAREEPPRIRAGIVGHPLVHFRTEPNHFGRDVVDQHRSANPRIIEIFEKGFGRATEFHDPIEISRLAFYKLECLRLEHLHRLDMNVAVSNEVIRHKERTL